MSYHIVQSIRIDDDKVFVTGADNNVVPRTPHEWECSFVEKWQQNGYPSLDVAILDGYESSNFQAGGQNKYTRALEALRKMSEYREFDWRGENWDQSTKNRAERKAEFYGLMTRAMQTRLPAKQYAITKDVCGTLAYFKHRKGSGICKWYYDKAKATLFRFQEDAEATRKYFTNSESWQVVKI